MYLLEKPIIDIMSFDIWDSSQLDHHVMKQLFCIKSHLKRSLWKVGHDLPGFFRKSFCWRVYPPQVETHHSTKVSQFCDPKNPAPHLWWHHLSGVVSGGSSSGYWKMDLNASWWAMKRKPGWLGYVGDYTTQLCRNCNKPISRSLLNNQYNGK